MLNDPAGIALDEAEQNLYIADMRNQRIRKINLQSWIITTVAGNGQSPPSQYTDVNDGTVSELGASLNAVALFDAPSDVAIDANGNIYVVDFAQNRIRKILANLSEIQTIHGDGYESTIARPRGIALNWAGEVFVSETEGARIWKLTPDGLPNPYPEAPYCADEPHPIWILFEAIKTAVGKELEAGMFEFGLYDEEDNLISTAANDAAGVVRFPPFALRASGFHVFTIRELGLTP